MKANPLAANNLKSMQFMPANKAMKGQQAYEEELNDKLPIQLKLSVGAVNDPLEYEADAMADRVMRMPASPFIQRCKCKDYDDEHVRLKSITPFIQTKSDGAEHVSSETSNRILSGTGNGSSMSGETKSFMESRFGADFSGVKIHNDNESADLSRSLNARAFTVSNDIYFNSGQYQPETESGKHLLAHELTHVLQQGSAVPHMLQRFESEEHQHLGDAATGSARYNLGTGADKFELTHGDILALSGDVFTPEDLFKFAAIPGKNGAGLGTRDEILWALQDPRIWEMRSEKDLTKKYAGTKDPRFEPGGSFAGMTFSDEVKAKVFERYQKLGAANAGHFVAPMDRDKKGQPLSSAESSVSNFVKYHEQAIIAADAAGRSGAGIEMAMAMEAAAQHFLTDSFSAGHLRTPIARIRDYWGKKYPLFWFNLQHKIALDTAIAMTKGRIITNHFGYTRILAQVQGMAPTLPAVTLGDLIASVYHDYDNEHGLSIGGGLKVFGDKHLDQGDTEKLAIAAIKAGNKDVENAFNNGKNATAAATNADLLKAIRKMNAGTGDQYAAQSMIPQPDKSEPSQNWEAADINALWDKKFLGTKGDTVGQVISKLVQGGPIAIQLIALGDRFPEQQDYVNSPRQSYLDGFVKHLQADPKAGILDIINWAGHDMSTGHTPLEVATDLEARGKVPGSTESLSGMTHEQRVKFVQGLIDDGDRAMINTILLSTDVVERQKVYSAVEGHRWTGAVKEKDHLAIMTTIKGKKVIKNGVETQEPDKDVPDKKAMEALSKIINGQP